MATSPEGSLPRPPFVPAGAGPESAHFKYDDPRKYRPGQRVYYRHHRAIVRYVGMTLWCADPDEWVGIALDEAGKPGKHDGAVDGTRYFTCDPGAGLFVRRRTLHRPGQQIAVYDKDHSQAAPTQLALESCVATRRALESCAPIGRRLGDETNRDAQSPPIRLTLTPSRPRRASDNESPVSAQLSTTRVSSPNDADLVPWQARASRGMELGGWRRARARVM